MHTQDGVGADHPAVPGATGSRVHSGPSQQAGQTAGSEKRTSRSPARPARPPAGRFGTRRSSGHPASSGEEPLKGLPGWAERTTRVPPASAGAPGRASRGRPPPPPPPSERASEPASATKRLPRQADLTDPARAVTRRRVGSDVSPAGRPQPGARLGDAPAPGLPLREADPAASRLARGRAGLGGVSGGPRLARPPRDTRAAAAPTGAAAGGPPWRPATT